MGSAPRRFFARQLAPCDTTSSVIGTENAAAAMCSAVSPPYPMVVGQPMPVLPIWLDNEHAISLDLEVSYQETCRALRLI